MKSEGLDQIPAEKGSTFSLLFTQKFALSSYKLTLSYKGGCERKQKVDSI